jgi:MFS family permease
MMSSAETNPGAQSVPSPVANAANTAVTFAPGGQLMEPRRAYIGGTYTPSTWSLSAAGEEKGESPPSDPLDRGWRAWSVVLGAFFCQLCAFGWLNSMGIFQDYYHANQLRGMSESKIAWILSIQSFLLFSSGLVVGKLCDNYGPRRLILTGGILHIGGLIGTSFADKYWSLMLAHGVCTSIGSGFLFYPAVSSVNSWFDKRRSLAFGIVMSGASAGGIIFPALLTSLLPKLGFANTMRVGCIVSLTSVTIALCTVRLRGQPQKSKVTLSEYVAPFKDRKFVLLALGASCGYCSMFLPANFLPVQADVHGIDPRLSGFLLVALNAGSWPGRILPAYLADKLGRFNMAMVACGLTVTFILSIWLPGMIAAPHQPAVYYVFSVLFGFSSGATVALLPSLLGAITPESAGIGLRQGVMFSLVALVCLAGGPAGGAIMEVGGSVGLQVFNAAIAFLALVFFGAARWELGTRDEIGNRKPFSFRDRK